MKQINCWCLKLNFYVSITARWKAICLAWIDLFVIAFFLSFLVQILEKENEAMYQLKQRQTI